MRKAGIMLRLRIRQAAWIILTAAFFHGESATAWGQAEAGRPGGKYALLIACQGYQQYQRAGFNDLSCTHADILAFAGALSESGFPQKNITLMYDDRRVD